MCEDNIKTYTTIKEMHKLFESIIKEEKKFNIEYYSNIMNIKLNPSKIFFGENYNSDRHCQFTIAFDNTSGFHLEDVKKIETDVCNIMGYDIENYYIYFKSGEKIYLSLSE